MNQTFHRHCVRMCLERSEAGKTIAEITQVAVLQCRTFKDLVKKLERSVK